MRHGTLLGGISILLSACSADDSNSAVTCAQAERAGTYLVSYATISGDCGDVPATVVRFTDDLPDGCALDEPDRWSEAECKLERSYTCVTADGAFSFVAVSTQDTDDGSKLSGTMSATMRDAATGQAICSGTYRLSATRQ